MVRLTAEKFLSDWAELAEMVYGRFPDGYFPGWSFSRIGRFPERRLPAGHFPGKTFPGWSFSRMIRFPERLREW